MIDASHAFYTSCCRYPNGTAENGFAKLIFKMDDAIQKEVHASEGNFGIRLPLSNNEEVLNKMRFAHDRVKSLVKYYESKGFRVSNETMITQSGSLWVGW